jgi:hypothetical protein
MAIENPEVIRFCNEKVRVLADMMAQVYYFAKMLKQESQANDIPGKLTGGGYVADGYDRDGRHPIDSNGVIGILYRADEFVTDYEANGNSKLNSIMAVAVNPQR